MENKVIHKKREKLCKDIDRAWANALDIEDRYWRGWLAYLLSGHPRGNCSTVCKEAFLQEVLP